MISFAKKVSVSILTVFFLVSFFSFNVSASAVDNSSGSYILLDEETPDTQGSSESPEITPYKAPAGATVSYRTRARYKKWDKKFKSQASIAGSVGKKKTLAAVQIKIKSSTSGKILYRTHAYKEGWGGWKTNGKTSGKKSYKLDMIQIKLTGALAEKYDIYYRVSCWQVNLFHKFVIVIVIVQF